MRMNMYGLAVVHHETRWDARANGQRAQATSYARRRPKPARTSCTQQVDGTRTQKPHRARGRAEDAATNH